MDFDDLVKYAKSVAAFLLAVNFKSDRVTSHKHDLAAKTVSNVTSFKTDFIKMAGPSEAETCVSGRGECLVAIGENKRQKSTEAFWSDLI